MGRRGSWWLMGAVFVVGCGDETNTGPDGNGTPESPGTVVVSSSVSGNGSDADGFTVTVSGQTQSLSPGGSVTFSDLDAGTFQVELSGLSSNCSLLDDATQTISVSAGGTSQVDFPVTCFGNIAFLSDRTGHEDIVFMDATGNTTTLTNNTAREVPAAWAPDGSSFLFRTNVDGNRELYVIYPDGTGLTNLTNHSDSDEEGQWSPDGSKILFTRWGADPSDLYLMDSDGSNVVNLTNTASDQESGGQWSPDGTSIAYEAGPFRSKDIHVMDSDGANPVNLTNRQADDVGPLWSPDGSLIAFSSLADPQELWIIEPDGTGLTQLYTGVYSNHQWTPDGAAVLISVEVDISTGDRDLVLVPVDGGSEVNLTSGAGIELEASWLPDGSWAIMSSQRDGGQHLWAVSQDGSQIVQITSGAQSDYGPFVRPN